MSKQWAIKLATEAARTILSVDQIIVARQAGGPKPPGPNKVSQNAHSVFSYCPLTSLCLAELGRGLSLTSLSKGCLLVLGLSGKREPRFRLREPNAQYLCWYLSGSRRVCIGQTQTIALKPACPGPFLSDGLETIDASSQRCQRFHDCHSDVPLAGASLALRDQHKQISLKTVSCPPPSR